MEQKTTFMKTIVLAAAMMLGESQAWAGDVTTLYHRALTTADGATVWSANFESIKVQQETQAIATYGYTVNYKEGSNVVKTVTGTQVEGALILLRPRC